MTFHRRLLVALTLVTAVAGGFAAGCSNNDNNNNPVAPSDTTAFTQDFAETVGLLAVEILGQAVSGVPSVAEGDVAGALGGFGLDRVMPGASALADTAVYDEGRHAWVYQDTVAFAAGGDSSWTAVDVAAQFMTGGAEHPDRTSWDTIHMLIGVDLFHRIHGSPTTDIVSAHHFDFNITPGPTGPWSVAGDGYSDTTVRTSLGTTDILPRAQYDFSFTEVQRGSCPAGTVTVTMGDYQLIATYDQTADVPWTLHHPVGGPTVKSDTLACGIGD